MTIAPDVLKDLRDTLATWKATAAHPPGNLSTRNEQLAHANQLFALRAHLWSLMMQPGVIESLLDAYHVLETQVLAKSIEDSIHSMGDPAAPETDPDLLQAAEAAASRLLNQKLPELYGDQNDCQSDQS